MIIERKDGDCNPLIVAKYPLIVARGGQEGIGDWGLGIVLGIEDGQTAERRGGEVARSQ